MTKKKVIQLSSHEEEIDALIPFAAKKADAETKKGKDWVRAYIDEMNRLAIEKGLRVSVEEILIAKGDGGEKK